jgi:hypothetical protein
MWCLRGQVIQFLRNANTSSELERSKDAAVLERNRRDRATVRIMVLVAACLRHQLWPRRCQGRCVNVCSMSSIIVVRGCHSVDYSQYMSRHVGEVSVIWKQRAA